MNLLTDVAVKSCSIEARIIRADGYRENLGRISFWDRGLLRRAEWKIRQTWKRLPGGLLVAVPMLVHAHRVPGWMSVIPLLPLPFATLQVDTGRAVVTAQMIAKTLYCAWGTGTGTTSATDTTLFYETFCATNDGTHNLRPSGSETQVTTSSTNDTFQEVTTMVAAQAQNGSAGTLTGPISNQGLFDSNGQAASESVATSGGNLYFKGDFAVLNLNSGDSISFTDKVQYS